MIVYTVCFAFSGDKVLLIRKAKPIWQAGLLNGIGGKLENGETILGATIREFREETELWDTDFHPIIYHSMLWPEYETHTGWPLVYFSAATIDSKDMYQAYQNTIDRSEPCIISKSVIVKSMQSSCMPNLPFLVAMAENLVLCTPEERKLRQPIVPSIYDWDCIIKNRGNAGRVTPE